MCGRRVGARLHTRSVSTCFGKDCEGSTGEKVRGGAFGRSAGTGPGARNCGSYWGRSFFGKFRTDAGIADAGLLCAGVSGTSRAGRAGIERSALSDSRPEIDGGNTGGTSTAGSKRADRRGIAIGNNFGLGRHTTFGLGFPPAAVLKRNPERRGWRRGLTACDIVASDVEAMDALPAGVKAPVLRILSDEFLCEMRELVAG